MRVRHIRPTQLPFPAYQTEGAAGLDLYADDERSEIWIHPGAIASIGTNLAAEIPDGFEGQVRGRSGLAFKHSVLGYLGTIDSDYRGEIKALLYNAGARPFRVARGDRIAQLVICPVAHVELVPATELSDSARGDRGFGSTGHRIWDACKGDGKGTPDEWADPKQAYERVFNKPYPLGGDDE